jgi:hypothetical protein
MHVGLHEVCDDVDVWVTGFILWLDDVKHGDDILMVERLYITI